MAYEFKAFTRARKIRSPMQLLQVVMIYCGLDLSLRSCAGEIAQLQGYLSDTAVKKRLTTCVPWVKAMLAGVFDLDGASLSVSRGQTDRDVCSPDALARTKSQRGQTPSQAKSEALNKLTRLLCSWTLILTSVPPQILDTKTVAALYRVRWQVELLIKRLKSLLDIDELRARKDSQLAELYLHGKLLYAAVIEKIMQERFFGAATKMDKPREITHWRLCRMVAEEIDSGLKAGFTLQEKQIQACIKIKLQLHRFVRFTF